jgi:hypothetical protein
MYSDIVDNTAFQFATVSSVALTLIMLIVSFATCTKYSSPDLLLQLVPLPMFGSGYVFSVKFFTGWVVVSIIWSFLSAFTTCLLPLWESKAALKFIGRQISNDLLGRRREPVV